MLFNQGISHPGHQFAHQNVIYIRDCSLRILMNIPRMLIRAWFIRLSDTGSRRQIVHPAPTARARWSSPGHNSSSNNRTSSNLKCSRRTRSSCHACSFKHSSRKYALSPVVDCVQCSLCNNAGRFSLVTQVCFYGHPNVFICSQLPLWDLPKGV